MIRANGEKRYFSPASVASMTRTLRKGEALAPHEDPERAREPAPRGVGEPEVTPALAEEFVKLLFAGFPPKSALRTLCPRYYKQINTHSRDNFVERVQSHPEVARATTKHLGNRRWLDLTPAERAKTSEDKHYAELAHYLFTHPFEDATPAELEKIAEARNALLAKQKADAGATESSVVERIVKQLLGDDGELADDGPRVKAAQPPSSKAVH